MTFGAWLGEILRLLHMSFSGWHWLRGKGADLSVEFADASAVSCTPSQTILLKDGPDGRRFMMLREVASEPDPSSQARPEQEPTLSEDFPEP